MDDGITSGPFSGSPKEDLKRVVDESAVRTADFRLQDEAVEWLVQVGDFETNFPPWVGAPRSAATGPPSLHH